MNVFKKTCFECGNKVDNLIDGRCENCFKAEFPPIKELKPIKALYCNNCKSIKFNNATISQKEFKDRMPTIVKKNLILNENYILKNIEISNFKIKNNKVEFDFEVDCDLK